MNISKRVLYCLLLTFYTWSLVLRYPNISGPHDADGFALSSNTFTITILGYNPWILSPLSYIGMYPFSSPFGTHTLFSALNQITGVEFETIILVLCILFGFLGLTLMFMLGKEFSGNNIIALSSLVVFSTTFYFYNYTFWSISPRGPFMVFVPLMLLLITKYHNSRGDYKFLGLSFASYFLLTTTHRMVVFVIPCIILPYILLALVSDFHKMFYGRKYYTKKIFRYSISTLLIIVLMLSIYASEALQNLGLPVKVLWIRTEFRDFLLSGLINVGYTYTTNSILFFFSIIGLIILIFKKHHPPKEIWLILVFLFSSPFFVNVEYFMPVIIPFLSLLGGLGIYHTFTFLERRFNQRSFLLVVIVILLLPLPYTFFIKDLNVSNSSAKNHPEVEGYGLSHETRNTALWTENFIPASERIIANSGRIDRISGSIELTVLEDTNLIATYPNLDKMINIESYPLYYVLFYQRGWIRGSYFYGGFVSDWSGVGENIPSNHNWIKVMTTNDKFLIKQYGVVYSIEYYKVDERFLSSEGDSPFLIEIHDSNYKIYENELWSTIFYKSGYK